MSASISGSLFCPLSLSLSLHWPVFWWYNLNEVTSLIWAKWSDARWAWLPTDHSRRKMKQTPNWSAGELIRLGASLRPRTPDKQTRWSNAPPCSVASGRRIISDWANLVDWANLCLEKWYWGAMLLEHLVQAQVLVWHNMHMYGMHACMFARVWCGHVWNPGWPILSANYATSGGGWRNTATVTLTSPPPRPSPPPPPLELSTRSN